MLPWNLWKLSESWVMSHQVSGPFGAAPRRSQWYTHLGHWHIADSGHCPCPEPVTSWPHVSFHQATFPVSENVQTIHLALSLSEMVNQGGKKVGKSGNGTDKSSVLDPKFPKCMWPHFEPLLPQWDRDIHVGTWCPNNVRPDAWNYCDRPKDNFAEIATDPFSFRSNMLLAVPRLEPCHGIPSFHVHAVTCQRCLGWSSCWTLPLVHGLDRRASDGTRHSTLDTGHRFRWQSIMRTLKAKQCSTSSRLKESQRT